MRPGRDEPGLATARDQHRPAGEHRRDVGADPLAATSTSSPDRGRSPTTRSARASVAAASALPPPRPAATGIRFSISTRAPRGVRRTRRRGRARRRARGSDPPIGNLSGEPRARRAPRRGAVGGRAPSRRRRARPGPRGSRGRGSRPRARASTRRNTLSFAGASRPDRPSASRSPSLGQERIASIRAKSSRPSRSARVAGSTPLATDDPFAHPASRPSRRSAFAIVFRRSANASSTTRNKAAAIDVHRRRARHEPNEHRVDLRARPEHVGRDAADDVARRRGTRRGRSPPRTPRRRATATSRSPTSRCTITTKRSIAGAARAGRTRAAPRCCTGGSRPSSSRSPSRSVDQSRASRRACPRGRSCGRRHDLLRARRRRAVELEREDLGNRPRRARASASRARRRPPARGRPGRRRRRRRSRARGSGRRGNADRATSSAGCRGGRRGPSALRGRGRPGRPAPGSPGEADLADPLARGGRSERRPRRQRSMIRPPKGPRSLITTWTRAAVGEVRDGDHRTERATRDGPR